MTFIESQSSLILVRVRRFSICVCGGGGGGEPGVAMSVMQIVSVYGSGYVYFFSLRLLHRHKLYLVPP